MTVESYAILRRKARLNAAVWRARSELLSARAGSACARREFTQGGGLSNAVLAERGAREALAEVAFAAACAAFLESAPAVSRAYRAAIPAPCRSNAYADGHTYEEAVAALRARFGEPDPERGHEAADGRATYWTRDVWSEGRAFNTRRAWRTFGVVETATDGRRGARVRVHGSASGTADWFGSAQVDAQVGVKASTSWDIEHTYLNSAAGADPGHDFNSPRPGTHDPWAIWSFDGHETAGDLLAGTSIPPPLVTVDVAVEAIARMLDVPRLRVAEPA